MNEEQLFKVVDTNFKETGSWRKIESALNDYLQAFNVDFTTVPKTANGWRKWYKRAKKRIGSPKAPKANDKRVEGVVKTSPDNILNDIWDITKLNPEEWDMASSFKVWGSGSNKNFSVQFTRSVPETDIIENFSQAIKADWSHIKPVDVNGELLFVPALFDAHLAKRGQQMTANDYLQVLANLLADAEKQGKIGAVLFYLGHDFGHIDNTSYTTTAGTPQETDGTYFDGVKLQTETAVGMIRYLAKRYKVHVAMTPGNHDRYSNVWLGEVMAHVFESHPNVVVDNGDNPRKYFKWGDVLLMSTHGNEEKFNNLTSLISTEARAYWGTTKHCEVLTGHFHTQRQFVQVLDEDHGIIIRWMPSLSKSDTWHITKGYVGNGQGAMGLLYYSDGFKSMNFVSLERIKNVK